MGLEVALFVFGVIFSIVGYFLRQKDARQESHIDKLFRLHDDDAISLQRLTLQIAKDHYQKEELDARFNKLEIAFQRGFDELGRKFDHLSEILINIRKEEVKRQ